MTAENVAVCIAIIGGIVIIAHLLKFQNRPVYEREPKEGDKFIAEVYTRYLMGGRTLNVSYHATQEQAIKAAKKNAKWFDAYGGVHRDVGIQWGVSPIQKEDEAAS